LASVGLVLYAGLFGKETSGKKFIWCSMPRGGNPFGGLEKHHQIPLANLPNNEGYLTPTHSQGS